MANIYLEKILFDLLSPGIEKHPEPKSILAQENVSLQEEDHYIGEKYTIAKRGDQYRIAKTSEVQRVIGGIIDTGFKRFGVWRSGPNQHGNVVLCAIPVRDFGKYTQGDDLLNSKKYNRNFSIAPASSIALEDNPVEAISESVFIEVKSTIGAKIVFCFYCHDNTEENEVIEIKSNKYSYEELIDMESSTIKYEKRIRKNNDIKFKRRDIAHTGHNKSEVVNYILKRYDKDKSNVKVIFKHLGKHGACFMENNVENDKTHLVITVAPTYSLDKKLSNAKDKAEAEAKVKAENKLFDNKLIEVLSIKDKSKELRDGINIEDIIKSFYYQFKPSNPENKEYLNTPAYVVSKKDIIGLYRSLQEKSKDKIPKDIEKYIENHKDVFLDVCDQKEEAISTLNKFINSLKISIKGVINTISRVHLCVNPKFFSRHILDRNIYQFLICLFEFMVNYIKQNELDGDILYTIYRLKEDSTTSVSSSSNSLSEHLRLELERPIDIPLFNYAKKIVFDKKYNNLYDYILIFNNFDKDKDFELIKFIERISYKSKEISIDCDKCIQIDFFIEITHLIDFMKEFIINNIQYDNYKENNSDLWTLFKDELLENKKAYQKKMPTIYKMLEKLDQQQSSDTLPSDTPKTGMKRPSSEGDEVYNYLKI